jgi:ABC-type transport system involved in multi-copper enzyme maturation permease subunit
MWVVWRQQRSIVIAFALLAVAVSAWVLIMGLNEQTLWREFLSAPCKGEFGGPTASNAKFCEGLQSSVSSSGKLNQVVLGIGVAFAPLFGLILGVNAVAQEIEQKTIRLAWTQSGSRVRWLMNKYLASVVSLVVILAPLCWLFSWWVGASHDAARITQKVFAISGFVEVACGIFCFALVVVVGLFVRRPGWSLAVGVVLFAAIFLGFTTQVLPSLGSPSVVVMQSTQLGEGSSSGFYSSGGAPANSWPLSTGYEPKTEKGVPSTSVINQGTNDMYHCAISETPPLSESYCAQHLGLTRVQLYIPGNQFWTLQSFEGGFYLIGAALLAALSLFAVRRATA